MDRKLDDRLKRFIKAELDLVKPDAQEEDSRLADIHRKIKERRVYMKMNKKKMVAAFAAALTIMAMGTVTVIAGGKITGLISFTDRNKTVYTKDELVQLAEKQMGTVPKLVDAFSNGFAFKEGDVVMVEGKDENQNTLISYPEISAAYGGGREVTLSINEHQDLIPQESAGSTKQEIYQGISLYVSEESYLFLPPDAEPSEEDLKLQDEGKLAISFGSSEEERKVFRHVGWSENGMDYLLFTFDEISLEDLTVMAREVIDAK